MFWDKKEEKALDNILSRMDKDFEELARQGEIESNDTVSCQDCKCLIKKSDAYEVDERTIGGLTQRVLHYCNKCKPAYTKVDYGHAAFDVSTTYYKELQVTKQGEPVGYKKVK